MLGNKVPLVLVFLVSQQGWRCVIGHVAEINLSLVSATSEVRIRATRKKLPVTEISGRVSTDHSIWTEIWVNKRHLSGVDAHSRR